MKFDSVSNIGFSGLWKATDVLKGKANNTNVTGGRDLDNIYLQTQTYHPFKDEEITLLLLQFFFDNLLIES